ncbi:helix-turn-helix domain-containing protein [Lactococcus garvieae]|uniref:helix-turn-helix domain-containing protein n=1 Tax=Lactococcus garvieae TaxID=1363 RepID=UPI002097EA4A|nr:helix-turn-helix transcriptional regulator [Lactococcus garvieae]MCO7128560.1 helix-turn-helix domain-containing protein [Lactococcus garvieae]
MRTNKEIVRILIEEKDKQGLSISELARRVDMAKSAISRYFNFTREFPLNRADDFAKVLGISTEYLLGISADENSKENKNELLNNPVGNSVIDETVVTMNKLDKPRQQIVLETAKKQHEQQEKEKVTSLEDYRLSDEFLDEQINQAVAYGGKPLSDNDKEFFKQLLKKTMKQKIDRGE